MNHLIQRGKVRSQVINIPEGLPELLSDITREVLRCQPTTECLCQFIIDYLHSVIITRDKARIAKSIIDRALRLVDEVIADMCICDIPQEKADKMCLAMEECFRSFLAQRRCERRKDKEIIKFSEVDMLDELIQKCKFTNDELKKSRPVIEAAYEKFVEAYMSANEQMDGTDCLYEYFKEREVKRMEEHLRWEAAKKIQANFRGFLVRKDMFLDEPQESQPAIDVETESEMLLKELAARKIQNFFRSHHHLKGEKGGDDDSKQDPCSPASQISLTARPADHHDLMQDEKQPEAIKQEESPTHEIKEDIKETIDQPVAEEVAEAAAEEVTVEAAAEEVTVEVAAEAPPEDVPEAAADENQEQ